jgi:hypothetical protein
MVYSELEMEVMADMIRHGYDFSDPFDIQAYWEVRLQ